MTDLLDRARVALADRYPVERQLGEGGAAIVFLAEDRKHHRRVAVKVLRPEVASALGADRFLREIELAARLSHPHILTLIDSGVANGLFYYVMPYVESDSLRARLQREGRLPIEGAVEIARAIAGALDHAHRHGIVHRDIKPENILLQGGLPVVTDFGIATALTTAGGERLTATGIAVGTPAYMSPEQVAGDPALDGRSDVYSLGCVLYEMLTGDPPFAGASAQAVMSKRITEPEPRVSAARHDVTAEIDDVVCQAMAREPANRFATGGQFAQALATARTGVSRARTAGHAEMSLAVLPFANLSADRENEYFSDGVAEEIMNALGQVPRLRVTARTSAFAFKGKNTNVREIGRALNVGHVLEGSVRRTGQRIRITAQLIDVSGGHQLWSERYDRELQDVFAVQDEIAAMIVSRLKAGLATAAPRERPKRSLDAHDAYLRGRFDVAKGTPESLLRSIGHFERAIRVDPDYAEAHLGIAEALSFYGLLAPVPPETLAQAHSSVARALELDDTLPEAHASLGCLQFWFGWQWAEAERSLARALALGPNSALAHYHYATLLVNLGRPNEAVAVSKRMVDLDPLWVAGHHVLGFCLYTAGQFAEATDASGRALAIAPDFVLSLDVKAFAELALGRHDHALDLFGRAVTLSPGDSIAMAGLVQTNARMGRMVEAHAVMRDIEERSSRNAILTSAVLWGQCALGQIEEAIALLPRMIAEHDIMVQCLTSFAWWDPLRGHPHFEALLRELKFPAYALAFSESRRLRAATPVPAVS